MFATEIMLANLQAELLRCRLFARYELAWLWSIASLRARSVVACFAAALRPVCSVGAAVDLYKGEESQV